MGECAVCERNVYQGHAPDCRWADPEPDVSAWRDRQGDVWTLGDDGLMHSHETAPFPREHVERKWGPLTPEPDVSAGPQ